MKKYLIVILSLLIVSCSVTQHKATKISRVCKKDEIATDCRKMAIGEMGTTTRGIKMEIEND